MTEHERLAKFFETLGAIGPQAEAMAAQLLKRADQQAVERGITREAALKRLLELVVQGRSGKVPDEFAGPPPGRANVD